MASQITRLIIACSTFYSGADQGKHPRSVSLAFMSEFHHENTKCGIRHKYVNCIQVSGSHIALVVIGKYSGHSFFYSYVQIG